MKHSNKMAETNQTNDLPRLTVFNWIRKAAVPLPRELLPCCVCIVYFPPWKWILILKKKTEVTTYSKDFRVCLFI